MPDWLEWIKVLAPVVMLIVSALISVAAYFGKKTIDGFGEEMKTLRSDHQNIEKEFRTSHQQLEVDFLKFQAHMPRIYTLKDDHIRHMTILEKKIDDNTSVTQTALAGINGDLKLLLREMPKRSSDG